VEPMTQTSKRKHTDREWAVVARRLIVGDGSPPIENAILHIREDRVAAVGDRSKVAISPDVEVMDLGDETLLPGLIDTHNHPSLKPIGFEASDYIPGQFYDPDARVTARALRNMRVDLLSGVTTVRCVGELNFIDVVLSRDVDQGLVAGPHVIPSGPRLAPSGGHVWIPEWSVDGPDNIRRVIKEYVERGSKLIKLGLLDETPEKTSYSDEELLAVVDQAHRLGVQVAAHCTGLWGSSIRHCIKNGVDVIEHVVPLTEQLVEEVARTKTAFSFTPFVYKLNWPQASDYWNVEDHEAKTAKEWIDFNAEAGAAYLEAHPQVMTQDRYFGREVFPALQPWMDSVKKAWQAGIPLAVGSDCPHGTHALNIEFLVECGIPPLDAISAATGAAARVSGIADTAGTLHPGKCADFISVRGNPVKEITALRDMHLIVCGGKRYDHLSFQ
jgi:imidazolonepropionase-like amidohydrolase